MYIVRAQKMRFSRLWSEQNFCQLGMRRSLSIVESVLQQKQLKSCQESKYMHRKNHTLSNFDVSIY
jgi:hypothetical protein